MNPITHALDDLQARIAELEQENARLQSYIEKAAFVDTMYGPMKGASSYYARGVDDGSKVADDLLEQVAFRAYRIGWLAHQDDDYPPEFEDMLRHDWEEEGGDRERLPRHLTDVQPSR